MLVGVWYSSTLSKLARANKFVLLCMMRLTNCYSDEICAGVFEVSDVSTYCKHDFAVNKPPQEGKAKCKWLFVNVSSATDSTSARLYCEADRASTP
jgi:hypothetical protein